MIKVDRVLIFVDGKVIEPDDVLCIWCNGDTTYQFFQIQKGDKSKSIAHVTRETADELDKQIRHNYHA